jgi:hypothetical protein
MEMTARVFVLVRDIDCVPQSVSAPYLSSESVRLPRHLSLLLLPRSLFLHIHSISVYCPQDESHQLCQRLLWT